MIAPFSTAELRRLSEAAPGEEWFADPTPWFGLEWGVRRATSVDGGKALLKCNENTPDEDERLACLIAYLGTHRAAILRRLEAADALAEAYDECRRGGCPLCRPMHEAAADYKKARGE